MNINEYHETKQWRKSRIKKLLITGECRYQKEDWG